MNYEINIITRDMIPSNIYLCNIDEWTKINHFKFENGLQCIVGANRHLSSKDAIESIKDELDNVFGTNSPEELQQYYYDNKLLVLLLILQLLSFRLNEKQHQFLFYQKEYVKT